MNEICGDNRFEIIARAKEHLLDATNIDTSEDEMKVLDSFLFRCWQMGWLDRYDRKTESSSEIPNNCEHITEDGVTCAKYPACDDCLDNPLNKVKASERLVKGKDEPTISILEQVEDEFKQFDREALILLIECQKERIAELLAKDEPQTQLTAKCLNCNNSKVCKEKHWDGCVYEPKDEKTCETCRHWKYIAHEWQCEACKCQGYEPKDEPQTERSE